MKTGVTAVKILKFSTRSGWAVSYRTRVLCLIKHHIPHKFYRRPSGCQILSGSFRENRNLNRCLESNPVLFTFSTRTAKQKTSRNDEGWNSVEKTEGIKKNAASVTGNFPEMHSWMQITGSQTHYSGMIRTECARQNDWKTRSIRTKLKTVHCSSTDRHANEM